MSKAKKRHIALARLRSSISELDYRRVCLLAGSGFAYRYIGERVFKDRSDAAVRQVGRILRAEGLKVRDYRNGENSVARGVVTALMRKKG